MTHDRSEDNPAAAGRAAGPAATKLPIRHIKFAVATPMYWSNTFSGGVLALLALAGLATLRRATR